MRAIRQLKASVLTVGASSIVILVLLILSSFPSSGDSQSSISDGIGPGGSAGGRIDVRYGDLVHVEWSLNRSIYHELTYKTEIKDGTSYGGPVHVGHERLGNLTFYSKINGTYTMMFTNDADDFVLIHMLMTGSSGSEVRIEWLYLSAGLFALAAIAVVVGTALRKTTLR